MTTGRRIVEVAILSLLALLFAAALPSRGRAAVGPSLTLHGSGVPSGSAAVYTIIVANLGDSAAPAVHLDGTAPGGVALHAAAPTRGACVVAIGAFSCDLGDIAPGYPALITLNAALGGTGALSFVASYAAGEAGKVSVAGGVPAITAPPTPNTTTQPATTLPPGEQSGFTQTLLAPSCQGAAPSVSIVGQNGFTLLVSGGLGTPPLQCLPAGCSAVTLSLQPGLTTQDVVTAVQGTTLVGLWQYDTVAGRWRAMYFAVSGAPTDPAPLVAGIEQYDICVRGPGSIVSH